MVSIVWLYESATLFILTINVSVSKSLKRIPIAIRLVVVSYLLALKITEIKY
jgi:hypothetical protein